MDEFWADDYKGSKMLDGWRVAYGGRGGAPQRMLAPGATNPRYATAVCSLPAIACSLHYALM